MEFKAQCRISFTRLKNVKTSHIHTYYRLTSLAVASTDLSPTAFFSKVQYDGTSKLKSQSTPRPLVFYIFQSLIFLILAWLFHIIPKIKVLNSIDRLQYTEFIQLFFTLQEIHPFGLFKSTISCPQRICFHLQNVSSQFSISGFIPDYIDILMRQDDKYCRIGT